MTDLDNIAQKIAIECGGTYKKHRVINDYLMSVFEKDGKETWATIKLSDIPQFES